MEMNNKNLINVAGVVGIVSCFLPWVGALGMSFSGSQGDGLIVVGLLASVVLANIFMPHDLEGQKRKRITLGVLSSLASAIVLFTFFSFALKIGLDKETAMFVNIQYGLILTVLSSVAATVFSFKG